MYVIKSKNTEYDYFCIHFKEFSKDIDYNEYGASLCAKDLATQFFHKYDAKDFFNIIERDLPNWFPKIVKYTK